MSEKETDGKIATRILKLKARLDALERYALDTAIELGDGFCEVRDRNDFDWDKIDAWLEKHCPGIDQDELAMFDEIADTDANGELEEAKSISEALNLIDKRHTEKERLSGQ